jgi:hypothetical protein
METFDFDLERSIKFVNKTYRKVFLEDDIIPEELEELCNEDLRGLGYRQDDYEGNY